MFQVLLCRLNLCCTLLGLILAKLLEYGLICVAIALFNETDKRKKNLFL